jgi:hypothetical protein
MTRQATSAIKAAPGSCKLRVEETETRDAIVTDGHAGTQRTIAYVAIGAESWGPLLAAAPDLLEALRKIYDDVPARPNMTEAGRVAMMAEIARAALDKAGAL